MVFSPKDVARAVCEVHKIRLKNLHVHTRAVKAARHGHFDIAAYLVGVAGGVNTVGVVALVKHQAHKQPAPVEIQLPLAALYLAHAEIRGGAVIAEFQPNVVEISLSDIPQHGIFYGQRHFCDAVGGDAGIARHGLFSEIHFCRELAVAA